MRLAEHRRFRLDAANAPAENGKAVDHGGVAIGPDNRIGIGIGGAVRLTLGPDSLGEIFDIDLMTDTRARRHDPEIRKCALAHI